MIRVTIEMIPRGIEDHPRRRHLGTIDIHNDGTSLSPRTRGNYVGKLSYRGAPERLWKGTYVEDFPRSRLTAYDLVYRVLRNVVGERNS